MTTSTPSIYGTIYDYATGKIIRSASREDWLRAQQHGERHTGAHRDADGTSIYCDGPEFDPATSREDFIDRFGHPGEAIAFEDRVRGALSINDMPSCVRRVRGGEEPDGEYWGWLVSEVDACEAEPVAV